MGDTSDFTKQELKLLEKLNKEAMKIAKSQLGVKTVKNK